MESIFTNWKERCSALGHLMTSLPSAKEKLQITKDIKALEKERVLGVNANGNKVKWTDNKIETLTKLQLKLAAVDELPQGAKSHLDGVFNDVYWKRRRLLHNKYLDKGHIAEDDGLDLISKLDNTFYIKNKEYLQNEFIHGTPDNAQGKIRDIKSNWDKETFDKAELTKLYEWQIKGYMWMAKLTEGELDYTLVNNPAHQISEAIKSIWFKMGCPDDEDEKYIKARQQVERNMIFDIQKFKDYYPGYEFENTVLDFDIPAVLRVKRFTGIELFPEDIKNIKKRVTLARAYLMEKEQEILDKINSVK